MIPCVPQVKCRQSDNMPKKPRTTSIHAKGAILERDETNYKGRIFLEFLHSNIDKNSVNERMEFPRAYVPLLRSLGNQDMKQ